MKAIVSIFTLLYLLTINVYGQKDTLHIASGHDGSDSVSYELIVLDPGYESYLLTQLPMNYYSQAYYESWNSRFVIEWNYRYMQPLKYGSLYEVYIDYRENLDYGLELNYKLYHYFRFFEKENNCKLL